MIAKASTQTPETRDQILAASYEQVRRRGFRAASLDRILDGIGLTKGAFYYHFENKAALGRAIVDEVIRSYIDRAWLGPLRSSPDPVEGIAAILEGMSSGDEKISELGCPLNNLVQELSVTDDAFQVKLQRLIDDVRDELAESLRSSKARGYVDMSVDCDAAGLAKGARDPAVIRLCGRGMSIYLDALRPGGRPGAATVRGREENLLSRRRAGAPSARQAQRCRTPPLPKPQLLRLDS